MSQLSGESIAFDISENISDVNSGIIWVFLSGIYTMIYANTVYAYVTRGKAQRLLVVSTITAIYTISMLQVGITWWLTIWQYAEDGDDTPRWWHILLDFNVLTVYVLSDVLLIWRCFYLWERSLRVMALPFILLVTEISLMISAVIYRGITHYNSDSSGPQTFRGDGLYLATCVISLVASGMATWLISCRIYSASKQNGCSEQRLKQILKIVTESSLFSSLSLVAVIIDFIVDDATLNGPANSSVYAFDEYIDALAFFISALAPTIMVARVALLTPDTTQPTITHISGLQFKGSSTLSDKSRDSIESFVVVSHGRSGVDIKIKEIA